MCQWINEWADGAHSGGASQRYQLITMPAATYTELLRCQSMFRQPPGTNCGLISDMFLANVLPMSLAESTEFHTLLAFLDPAYKPPSCQTMTPFDNQKLVSVDRQPVMEKIPF